MHSIHFWIINIIDHLKKHMTSHIRSRAFNFKMNIFLFQNHAIIKQVILMVDKYVNVFIV